MADQYPFTRVDDGITTSFLTYDEKVEVAHALDSNSVFLRADVCGWFEPADLRALAQALADKINEVADMLERRPQVRIALNAKNTDLLYYDQNTQRFEQAIPGQTYDKYYRRPLVGEGVEEAED